MCNQMVTSEIITINIMADELCQQSWIFDMFILDRINRELHSLELLWLKYDSNLEFYCKIPVRILLDELFGEFRFSKATLYALASSFMTF